MVSLASSADVLAVLARGREIALSAYTLNSPRLIDALAAAAARGARVCVELPSAPYHSDGLALANAARARELRRAGIEVRLEDGIHEKSLVVDGAVYLDDANWLAHGGDTIVRDDDAGDPAIARTKGAALALEDRLIAGAGDTVDLETESFGNGPVSGMLERAAQRGVHVRILVAARETRNNSHEAATIAALVRAGAQVRLTDATEKFAVAGDNVWVGSANATYGVFDQTDWGTVTGDAAIRAHISTAFESRWSASK